MVRQWFDKELTNRCSPTIAQRIALDFLSFDCAQLIALNFELNFLLFAWLQSLSKHYFRLFTLSFRL